MKWCQEKDEDEDEDEDEEMVVEELRRRWRKKKSTVYILKMLNKLLQLLLFKTSHCNG